MPTSYRFENQDIRVVFIDAEPWLVRDDLASCLSITPKKFQALVRDYESGLAPKDICTIQLPGSKPGSPPTCLYSPKAAGRFALLSAGHEARRFQRWLDGLFNQASGPVVFDRRRGCQHFYALQERLQYALDALDGFIDLLGTIYHTQQDLHEVDTAALTRLLRLVRNEFKASETLMDFACRCVSDAARKSLATRTVTAP